MRTSASACSARRASECSDVRRHERLTAPRRCALGGVATPSCCACLASASRWRAAMISSTVERFSSCRGGRVGGCVVPAAAAAGAEAWGAAEAVTEAGTGGGRVHLVHLLKVLLGEGGRGQLPRQQPRVPQLARRPLLGSTRGGAKGRHAVAVAGAGAVWRAARDGQGAAGGAEDGRGGWVWREPRACLERSSSIFLKASASVFSISRKEGTVSRKAAKCCDSRTSSLHDSVHRADAARAQLHQSASSPNHGRSPPERYVARGELTPACSEVPVSRSAGRARGVRRLRVRLSAGVPSTPARSR
jgi:hypothetical protein